MKRFLVVCVFAAVAAHTWAQEEEAPVAETSADLTVAAPEEEDDSNIFSSMSYGHPYGLHGLPLYGGLGLHGLGYGGLGYGYGGLGLGLGLGHGLGHGLGLGLGLGYGHHRV